MKGILNSLQPFPPPPLPFMPQPKHMVPYRPTSFGTPALQRSRSFPNFPANPFLLNTPGGSRFDVESAVIQPFLPALARKVAVYQYPPLTIAEKFAQSNVPRGENDCCDPDTLYNAYSASLEAIQRAGGSEDQFVWLLLGHLQSAGSTIFPGGIRGSGKESLRLFSSFAEVSRQTKSRLVAEVLFQFFQENIDDIEAEDPRLQIYWAQAIRRSHMQDSDKQECYRQLLRNDPSWLDSSRYGHDPWLRGLVRELEWVAEGAGESHGDGRRGRIPSSRKRRPQSGPRWPPYPYQGRSRSTVGERRAADRLEEASDSLMEAAYDLRGY